MTRMEVLKENRPGALPGDTRQEHALDLRSKRRRGKHARRPRRGRNREKRYWWFPGVVAALVLSVCA